MKSILLGFILIFSSSMLFGQTEYEEVINVDSRANTSEVYSVKKDQNEIKEGKYIFRYKRKIQVEGQYSNNNKTGKWTYTPNSKFVIVGSYKNNLKDGEWVYSQKRNVVSVLKYTNDSLDGKQLGYYEDGSIASELNYNNGKQDGLAKRYYIDGELKEITHYKNGMLHGENIKYSEEGQIISKISYHNDTPVSLDVQTDKANYSGNLKDGNGYLRAINLKDNREQVLLECHFKDSLLNGEIVGYTPNGNITFTGQYKNGYMIDKWNFYDPSGEINHSNIYLLSQKLKTDLKEGIIFNLNERFYQVEDMPRFGNYDTGLFQKFITQVVRYPETCLNNGIRGKVYVNFVINKEGRIENVKIGKSVHPLIDQEAIKVVKSSPLWTPALLSKIPVKVSYTVPINFDFM